MTERERERDLSALEGEGAVLELLGELAALVLEAVVLDHRRDEAKAGVGGVDPDGVHALQQELERVAEGAGLLLGGGRALHGRTHRDPPRLALLGATGGLDLLCFALDKVCV
jgi:hypothetical protein